MKYYRSDMYIICNVSLKNQKDLAAYSYNIGSMLRPMIVSLERSVWQNFNVPV